MDNNIAEQTLRGPVVGRKNYYGSGSDWSMELAAWFFTVLTSLKDLEDQSEAVVEGLS